MTGSNPQEGGKHTPGAWVVIETGFNGDVFLVCEDQPGRLKPICAMEHGHPLAEENARLVSAAPALYAALKAILSNSNRADITVKQWRAGLDALLQATGGENGR